MSNDPENPVFTYQQQIELFHLFGRLPDAGKAGLKPVYKFEDLRENLLRYEAYMNRQRKLDHEDRKELDELRRQRDAIRHFLSTVTL